MSIRAIQMEAESIWSLALAPADNFTLPPYLPGSHIDLHIPGSFVRQYSLTGPFNGRHYEIAVALDRNSRGGSRWIHQQARPGLRLEISAPRNTFLLDSDAYLSIFFAGGIGITPIRAMVRDLHQDGRAWTLHYAARTRQSAAFADDLHALGAMTHLHFDDEAGALFDMAAAVAAAPADAHLYCCGPEPMIAAFLDVTKGRAPGRIHVEHFTTQQPKPSDGTLLVELARSGMLVEVGPDETILEAILAAGIAAPCSCRNGVCGTCETRVLAGIPDHRDLILSEAEKQAGQTMMICCSRAKTSRLTLDL